MRDEIHMNFKHFSLSDVGEVRKANEDNCADRMTVNGYVYVVCDGMGGHVGGATASDIAVKSILDFFETPVSNLIIGINDALRFANTKVFEASQKNSELKGMGTTATVLVINATDCYIGHVGDSRIYLYSDGNLNRLTKDHSFVQGLVDQGIISDADTENHPKKNQILQAIGIKSSIEPSVCEAPIQPKQGDCFLLCSDGLNGMLQDHEIEQLINPSDLEVSVHGLINAANKAGGKDNITATLVTITESPYVISVFKDFNPIVTGMATIIEPLVKIPVAQPKKSKRWILLFYGFILLLLCVISVFVFHDMTSSTVPPSSLTNDSLKGKDSIVPLKKEVRTIDEKPSKKKANTKSSEKAKKEKVLKAPAKIQVKKEGEVKEVQLKPVAETSKENDKTKSVDTLRRFDKEPSDTTTTNKEEIIKLDEENNESGE